MKDSEFDALRSRFGPDPSTWPSPWRRMAGQQLDDDPIDGLVREAAIEQVAPGELARKTLGRTQAKTPGMVGNRWASSLAMGAFAALLAVAALGGNRLAGAIDTSGQDALLGLASGAPGMLLDLNLDTTGEAL